MTRSSSIAQGVQNEWIGECTDRGTLGLAPQRTDKPWFGLSPGWGDAYPNSAEGNYIEFGTNGDGLYVVQVAVDPDDVLETSENDNLG